MSEDSVHPKKSGFVKRLFKAVGQAGSAVGGVAGDLLKSAGQTAKNAGGRAAVSFIKDADQAPEQTLLELSDSLTQWLVTEHRGKADLQRQKPSTVELNELAQDSTFYEVTLEEPGLLGRRFIFVLRKTPLSPFASNFPNTQVSTDRQVLVVLNWPQDLLEEPGDVVVIVWDQACVLGRRNPASDLAQQWIQDVAGGVFPGKAVIEKSKEPKSLSVPIFGRDEELAESRNLILTPRPRERSKKLILSLAAPGGTGKSFFLKSLKASVSHRTKWAGVDHQGIEGDASAAELLGRVLAQLAQSFEGQGLKMERFRKEFRIFRRALESGQSSNPGGFFGHLRSAAETAAGINPVLGAVSAGVVFLTSWGQEQKEESEALAKDDSIKCLTDAFKFDLVDYSKDSSDKFLAWKRPVIVFDTYEWLAPLLDIWMRTEFLSDDFLTRSRVLLILSGREHLLRTDTRWSEWQHCISKITLRPFKRSISDAYLQSIDVAEERYEELFELTEGLPLFLSLAAHITEQDQAVGVLAERVLEEVPAEHRVDFLKASVLDGFDRSAVDSLFSERSEEQQARIFELLTRATFTVAKDGRRCFLESVRRVFRRALVLDLGEKAVKDLESVVQ